MPQTRHEGVIVEVEEDGVAIVSRLDPCVEMSGKMSWVWVGSAGVVEAVIRELDSSRDAMRSLGKKNNDSERSWTGMGDCEVELLAIVVVSVMIMRKRECVCEERKKK